MGYITVFTIFIIAALLAVKWNEDFYDTFPMVVSGFILFMYIFAFAKGLAYVDYAMFGLLIGILTAVLLLKGEAGKKRFKQACGLLISWKSILLLVILLCITFLVKDRVAVWWDDINYWAVDAKALYYNGGFAGKYGNVAPEFGDYPPALQVFKWFFLHFSPNVFVEGLMFAAYYCLNLIYMLPLLNRLDRKKPGFIAVGLAGIFLLPFIADNVASMGTCADVTMGIIYGAFLWAVFDDKEHSDMFYYSRAALYLCVLVLTKSVGIEWAFFGMVFFILFKYKREKEQGKSVKKIHRYVFLLSAVFLVTEGSWLLFCLKNRRVAKLTGAGVRIAVSRDFSFLKNAAEKMKIFMEGFFCYPMHSDKTWGIDISTGVMLALFILLAFLLYYLRFLQKWELKRCLLFIAITSLMAYGIIFLGHITIFAGELQYAEPSVMAKSIARYGAPFTIGLLYLFMGILTRQKGMYGYVICFTAILLTTSFPAAFQGLYRYRATLKEDIALREEMIEENAKIFLQKIALKKAETEDNEIFTKRTLYLRDDETIHWVKDTYISYEASPVPVVYGGISSSMNKEMLNKTIQDSHAAYLYADKVKGDTAHLFADMLKDGAFEYETIYEIEERDGVLILNKMD